MDDLTRYIYPLEEKLVLSNRIQLSFDNLREANEIEYLERIIRLSFQELPTLRIPEDFLTSQLQKFLRANSGNPYIKRLCTEYADLNGVQILARIWVIQRWEDTPFDLEKISYLYSFLLKEHHTYLTNISMIMLDDLFRDEHAINIVYSIYYFLSQNTDPASLTGIVQENTANRTQNANNDDSRHASSFWDQFYLEAFLPDMKSIEEPFYFPNIKEKFIHISQWIDAQSSRDFEEKLAFVADYLHLIDEAKDDRIALVLQVSILEALLTHIPFRDNGDDSVSKQFQTKVAKLIMENTQNKNPDELRTQIREIYSIRSQIAHGDLRVAHYSKTNSENDFITSLKKELEEYLRLIVLEYVKNPNAINNLKQR